MHIPRALSLDLDTENSGMFGRPIAMKISTEQTFVASPFFTLLDLKNLPQEDELKKTALGVYTVNGMFGTVNSESITRVVLTTQLASTQKLCEKIMKAQAGKKVVFKASKKSELMPFLNLLW